MFTIPCYSILCKNQGSDWQFLCISVLFWNLPLQHVGDERRVFFLSSCWHNSSALNSLAFGDKRLNYRVCRGPAILHVIGQEILEPWGQKLWHSFKFNHMNLLPEIFTQHGLHDHPYASKPCWRMHNQEESHSGRYTTTLETHHKLETVIDIEVSHLPVCHVGNKPNTISTGLLVVQHAFHYIHQVVYHGCDRSLLRKVSWRPHVKHCIQWWGTRQVSKCLNKTSHLQWA